MQIVLSDKEIHYIQTKVSLEQTKIEHIINLHYAWFSVSEIAKKTGISEHNVTIVMTSLWRYHRNEYEKLDCLRGNGSL